MPHLKMLSLEDKTRKVAKLFNSAGEVAEYNSLHDYLILSDEQSYKKLKEKGLSNYETLVIQASSPLSEKEYQKLFKKLTNITELCLHGKPKNLVPKTLAALTKVTTLILTHSNNIASNLSEKELGEIITACPLLEKLDIDYPLTCAPSLKNVDNLAYLIVHQCSQRNAPIYLQLLKNCPASLKHISFYDATEDLVNTLSESPYLAKRPLLLPNLEKIDCFNENGTLFYCKNFNKKGFLAFHTRPNRGWIPRAYDTLKDAFKKLKPDSWSWTGCGFYALAYLPLNSLIYSLAKKNAVSELLYIIGYSPLDLWGPHTANLSLNDYGIFGITRPTLILVTLGIIGFPQNFEDDLFCKHFPWITLSTLLLLHTLKGDCVPDESSFGLTDFIEGLIKPIKDAFTQLSLYSFANKQATLVNKKVEAAAVKKEIKKRDDKVIMQLKNALQGINKSGLAEISSDPSQKLLALTIENKPRWARDVLNLNKTKSFQTIAAHDLSAVTDLRIEEDSSLTREEFKKLFGMLPAITTLDIRGVPPTLQLADLAPLTKAINCIIGPLNGETQIISNKEIEDLLTHHLPSVTSLEITQSVTEPLNLQNTKLTKLTLKASAFKPVKKYLTQINSCPPTIETIAFKSATANFTNFLTQTSKLEKQPPSLTKLKEITANFKFETFIKKFNQNGLAEKTSPLWDGSFIDIGATDTFQEFADHDLSRPTKLIIHEKSCLEPEEYRNLFSKLTNVSRLVLDGIPKGLHLKDLALLAKITAFQIGRPGNKNDQTFTNEELEELITYLPALTTLEVYQPITTPLKLQNTKLTTLILGSCEELLPKEAFEHLCNCPTLLENIEFLNTQQFEKLKKDPLLTQRPTQLPQLKKLSISSYRSSTFTRLFDKNDVITDTKLVLDQNSIYEAVQQKNFAEIRQLTITPTSSLTQEEHKKLFIQLTNVTKLRLDGIPKDFNPEDLAQLVNVKKCILNFKEINEVIPYLPTVEILKIKQPLTAPLSLEMAKNLYSLILQKCSHTADPSLYLQLIFNCPASLQYISFTETPKTLVDGIQQNPTLENRPTNLPNLCRIDCYKGTNRFKDEYYFKSFDEKSGNPTEKGSGRLLFDRVPDFFKQEYHAFKDTLPGIKPANWSWAAFGAFALLYFPVAKKLGSISSFIPLVRRFSNIGISPLDIWGPHMANLSWTSYVLFLTMRTPLALLGLRKETSPIITLLSLLLAHRFKPITDELWTELKNSKEYQSCIKEINSTTKVVKETLSPYIASIKRLPLYQKGYNYYLSAWHQKSQIYHKAVQYATTLKESLVSNLKSNQENMPAPTLSENGLWWRNTLGATGTWGRKLIKRNFKEAWHDIRAPLSLQKGKAVITQEANIMTETAQTVAASTWSWKAYALAAFLYFPLSKKCTSYAPRLSLITRPLTKIGFNPLDLYGPLATNLSWLEHPIFTYARNALIPLVTKRLFHLSTNLKAPIISGVMDLTALPVAFLISSFITYRLLRGAEGFIEGATSLARETTLYQKVAKGYSPNVATLKKQWLYQKAAPFLMRRKACTTPLQNPLKTAGESCYWAVKKVALLGKDLATNPLLWSVIAIAGLGIAWKQFIYAMMEEPVFSKTIPFTLENDTLTLQNYGKEVSSLLRSVTASTTTLLTDQATKLVRQGTAAMKQSLPPT